jgi:hypothetical protein
MCSLHSQIAIVLQTVKLGMICLISIIGAIVVFSTLRKIIHKTGW